MKKIILLSILIAGYSLTLLSQQKYAVLICGQKPTEYYTANAETGWGDPGDTIKNEFWNDTYLMWEMLVFEKGYSDKNVFVLFANGNDYYINDIANRYNAEVRHEEYYPMFLMFLRAWPADKMDSQKSHKMTFCLSGLLGMVASVVSSNSSLASICITVNTFVILN
jgi:hypothetical protein